MRVSYRLTGNSLCLDRTWDVHPRHITTLFLFILLIWLLLSPLLVSAFAGLGGYISEKMLGDGTNEALFLGDGADELVVIGSVPIVSTLPVTDSTSIGGVMSATLHGNLSDLNGMPRADTWFVWGYSPTSMPNTTTTSVATVTGEQSTVIHPNAGQTVYYQFKAGTDGISTGSTLSFLAGGAHGVSYWLLNTVLPIIIAASILILVLGLTGNPLAAFIGSVIGLATFYIIQSFVQML